MVLMWAKLVINNLPIIISYCVMYVYILLELKYLQHNNQSQVGQKKHFEIIQILILTNHLSADIISIIMSPFQTNSCTKHLLVTLTQFPDLIKGNLSFDNISYPRHLTYCKEFI